MGNRNEVDITPGRRVTVETFNDSSFGIEFKGRDMDVTQFWAVGSREAERIIDALADAMGKVAKLEDKPKPPIKHFPKVGTILRSRYGYLYTRISENEWLSNS